MKKITGLFLCSFLFVAATMTASAQQDYCFENEGLKLKQIVRMMIIGNKVEGVMESGAYDAGNMETFEFTGTKAGSVLTLKFTGGIPYERAPGTKKIVWMFRPPTLKIPMYGKNYNTNKYGGYTASFKPCENQAAFGMK